MDCLKKLRKTLFCHTDVDARAYVRTVINAPGECVRYSDCITFSTDVIAADYANCVVDVHDNLMASCSIKEHKCTLRNI